MIDILIPILKQILMLLPFYLLSIYSKKVNLSIIERSKQFVMPLIALVFVAITMNYAVKINELLLKLISWIPTWISELSFVSWMPDKLSEILYTIAKLLKAFLENINLNLWVFFIANAVILLGYFIIKKIVLAIIKRTVKMGEGIHSEIAGIFYEYVEDKGVWCLKENYVQMRALLSVFYTAALVLSSLLMLRSIRYYLDSELKTVFYPVYGIILVGEIYFYLCGYTRNEYLKNVAGEDESAYKILNYSLLRKSLKALFGDKLLAENTSNHEELTLNVTMEEVIHELEKSEDPTISNFSLYVSKLNQSGMQIDQNYIYSTCEMLRGKSILFNNPFYSDLIPYAFYPMNRTLLSHKKVLIVLGRHGIEEDIKEWIYRGIESVTNIPFLWNVGELESQTKDLDIGIISRSNILNNELHEANAKFLEEVGFFVIIEPSKLITTAQIGLNLLVKKCNTDKKEVVYCVCDKNCDGLVDAMSHILMTSITEVSATKKHMGTSSYMCWEADDDYLHHRMMPNISRYLGMGTELSFAALKNQVSKASWFGGEAFPVTDIRWIDKQYYYELTKYAGLPTTQESMDKHFTTSSNFWSAKISDNNYFTVEDESYNMFEILRNFATRSTEQGFINVISSEYLLKDYMVNNASVFETDSKAIPSIVADYARSNRNIILRIILMMTSYPVNVEFLEKEFSLLGIKVFDLRQQLWYELYKCYTDVESILTLPENYQLAVHRVYGKEIIIKGEKFAKDILKVKPKYNLKSGKIETVYSISDKRFLACCISELTSAGYIAEDEQGEKYYLGSELSGHVYQKYLPGQFFTFAGKYYEMQYLTAEGQILVRRSADHIHSRPTYRQVRTYKVHNMITSDKIGDIKDVDGLKVLKAYADISVITDGYYKMNRYNDFTSAQLVKLGEEHGRIPVRHYFNKEILCIELPEYEGLLDDNIRYTIVVLINEIFRTLFAENQAYICAVTDDSFLADQDDTKPFTYTLEVNEERCNKKAIYIIEDSQLDLGLTIAVERNINRIFSIIYDYLEWHLATLEESLDPTEEVEKGHIIFDNHNEVDDETEQEEKEAEESDTTEVTDVEESNSAEEKDADESDSSEAKDADESDSAEEKETDESDSAEEKETDESDSSEEKDEEESDSSEAKDVKISEEKLNESSVNHEHENSNQELDTQDDDISSFSTERKPYHASYYMLYGREDELLFIDLPKTYDYLSKLGVQNNALQQVRRGKKIIEQMESSFVPGKTNSKYCDFCGSELLGVEYEILSDGRERCNHCSKSAIKTGKGFCEIFDNVKQNLETFFGIKIDTPIKVKMVNAKTLHKKIGKAFIPTPKHDGRVVGVAISDRNGYTLLIENGAPRMSSILTIAHELTHIWQYLNWNDKQIMKTYGKNMRLEIYEGMAKWVEIQYAYLINEVTVAKREEIITANRNDEYGYGLLRYKANYPFSYGTLITKTTPFMNQKMPLDLEYCGTFTYIPINYGQAGNDEEDTKKKQVKRKNIFKDPIVGTIQRNPNVIVRYAYESLNDNEQNIYNCILKGIQNFDKELVVTEYSVDVNCVTKIAAYIRKDYPEIFWLPYVTMSYEKDTNVDKVEFVYCMSQEEANQRQAKIEESLKLFKASITDKMSDFEVVLRVYENIINLVDYDTIGLEKQKSMNSSERVPDDLRSIYGVFVDKKAVCAGYAKATQYLLNSYGIECLYVVSDTHAWNIVKLEDEYYHIDTTWGDGSNTDKSKNAKDALKYDYFCITTDEVMKLEEHSPLKDLKLPNCTSTKCNYYRRFGLYYKDYQYEQIREVVCKCIQAEKLNITFKFATVEGYSKAKEDLMSDEKFREIIQYVNLKLRTRISNSYSVLGNEEQKLLTFYMNKGE